MTLDNLLKIESRLHDYIGFINACYMIKEIMNCDESNCQCKDRLFYHIADSILSFIKLITKKKYLNFDELPIEKWGIGVQRHDLHDRR